jgi:Heavy metal binding domain
MVGANAMSTSDSNSPRSDHKSTRALMLKGLEVRLRFFLGIGLLAILATGWPWIRVAWDQLLAMTNSTSNESIVSGDTEYFCPMDPGVISGWPAICPICNMDLITRKKSDAKLLPEGVLSRMQISPYRMQLAGVRTVPVVTSESHSASSTDSTRNTSPSVSDEKLLIPTTAVIKNGNDRIVYVESVPGMFDGILVTLGEQQGSLVEVQSGLKTGQRVVALASFLVDAESRLNPSLATQYFGANSQASSPPPLPKKKSESTQLTLDLTGDELAFVLKQRNCPVTDEPLGSMGNPIIIEVTGRKIAICCRGCEDSIREAPEKYFAKVDAVSRNTTDDNTDDGGE